MLRQFAAKGNSGPTATALPAMTPGLAQGLVPALRTPTAIIPSVM
jgi:hypothetical protein